MRLANLIAVSTLLASCAAGPSDRQRDVAVCMNQALTGFPGVTNVTTALGDGEMLIDFVLARPSATAIPGTIHIVRQPAGVSPPVGFWLALDSKEWSRIQELLVTKCQGAGDVVVVT